MQPHPQVPPNTASDAGSRAGWLSATDHDDSSAVEIAVNGDDAVVLIVGEIDLSNADHARELGITAITDARVSSVVIDLARVTYLDSTGLTVLLDLRERAKEAGVRFRLRDIPPAVSKILRITHTERILGPAGAGGAGR